MRAQGYCAAVATWLLAGCTTNYYLVDEMAARPPQAYPETVQLVPSADAKASALLQQTTLYRTAPQAAVTLRDAHLQYYGGCGNPLLASGLTLGLLPVSIPGGGRLVYRLQRDGRTYDVLVNNVGVLNDDLEVTSEGREASFTINFLSHYLLTEGMIRRGLLRTPGGLVINMTSGGGYNAPLGTAFMNVTDPRKFNGTVAYAFHKRGQMVLNQYWRSTYGPRGLTFYVMHPGWADTDGVKRSLPRFRKILKSILRDSASGGDTAIWLAATRPSQPEQELVWFDRAIRPAHVYERTRTTKDTPQTLVAYLDRELARFPESMP